MLGVSFPAFSVAFFFLFGLAIIRGSSGGVLFTISSLGRCFFLGGPFSLFSANLWSRSDAISRLMGLMFNASSFTFILFARNSSLLLWNNSLLTSLRSLRNCCSDKT